MTEQLSIVRKYAFHNENTSHTNIGSKDKVWTKLESKE